MTDRLEGLTKRTCISLSTYMREALENLLKKYDAPAKEAENSKRTLE